MTKLKVMSRQKAEASKLEECAVISITDPSYREAVIEARDILRLKFYDIPSGNNFGLYGHYAMSHKDAEKVVDFVEKWWDKVDTMVVQCEAGISRSAGVAGAISKAMTGTDTEFFDLNRYYPNMYCYTLVLNEFMRRRV